MYFELFFHVISFFKALKINTTKRDLRNDWMCATTKLIQIFLFFLQSIESPLKKLNAASPSTSKASFAADPLSLIQAKADTFDGLDPLSMFAAQEASSNKTAAVASSASVTTKEKVHVHL